MFWFLFGILACACLANAVGDIFLLRGVRETGWDPGFAALQHTASSDIKRGTLLGLLTVPFWFAIIPLAVRLGGVAGWVFVLAYLGYVAITLTFHVAYGITGLSLKAAPDLEAPLSKIIGGLAGSSFLLGLVSSVALGIHIFHSGQSSWYLLATPASMIVLCQFVLGRLLSRVPYYLVISGPLGMFGFFTGFLLYSRQLGLLS